MTIDFVFTTFQQTYFNGLTYFIFFRFNCSHAIIVATLPRHLSSTRFLICKSSWRGWKMKKLHSITCYINTAFFLSSPLRPSARVGGSHWHTLQVEREMVKYSLESLGVTFFSFIATLLLYMISPRGPFFSLCFSCAAFFLPLLTQSISVEVKKVPHQIPLWYPPRLSSRTVHFTVTLH